MADTEVENVLREIRERVRAEAAERATLVAGAAGERGDEGRTTHVGGESVSPALARMEANLATTERTWNRLPPLVSNRTGWAARLELWVKRMIKRVLHWFTWEQVNFNASVHHALRDAAAALTETRAELAALRQTNDELKSRLQAQDAEIARLHETLRAAIAQQRDEGRALADIVIQLRDEGRALAAAHEEQVAALRGDRDERAEHLREELRVCFRQLSLEAGEAAVTHDRARRHLETRLEAIEKVLRTED